MSVFAFEAKLGFLNLMALKLRRGNDHKGWLVAATVAVLVCATVPLDVARAWLFVGLNCFGLGRARGSALADSAFAFGCQVRASYPQARWSRPEI